MALDPKLYARLRERQRAKKQQTIASLAGLITGEQGIDYQAPWKRLQEQQTLMDPSVSALEQSTQFYFGKEFEAKKLQDQQKHDMLIQEIDTLIKDAELNQRAAEATALNRMKDLELKIKEIERDQDLLDMQRNTVADEQAGLLLEEAKVQAEVASQRPGGTLPEAAFAAAGRNHRDSKRLYELMNLSAEEASPGERAALLSKYNIPPGTDPEEAQKQVQKAIQQQAYADYRMGTDTMSVDEDGLTDQGLTPAQAIDQGNRLITATEAALATTPELAGAAAPTLLRAYSQMGLSPNQAIAALEQFRPDLAEEARAEFTRQTQSMEYLNLERQNAQDERTKVASAYGDDSPIGKAERLAKQYYAEKEALLEQSRQAFDAAVGPGEEDERTSNFYSVLAQPQGPAADKRLEMLQAIEEYEDLPSAQSIKADIFNSPEFQQYMEERQVYDPDIAFKLMNREARAMKRASRSQARQRVRQLVKEGQLSRQDAASVVDVPEAPEAPAAQAVAERAADRVASDLAGGDPRKEKDQQQQPPG